jgi:hypothetical protein
MSYDFYIVNRQLTKTEIKEKTDLEIRTQEKNGDWIVDKYGNGISIVEGYYKTGNDGNRVEIKDDIVRQLCRYGANNPTYIIDTLLKTFPFVFYGDDGRDILIRMNKHDNSVFKKCIVDDMEYCGYKVIDIDNCIVEIPERTEKDYEPEKSESSKPLPPIGSMDQTYLSNLSDEDLPF